MSEQSEQRQLDHIEHKLDRLLWLTLEHVIADKRLCDIEQKLADLKVVTDRIDENVQKLVAALPNPHEIIGIGVKQDSAVELPAQ